MVKWLLAATVLTGVAVAIMVVVGLRNQKLIMSDSDQTAPTMATEVERDLSGEHRE